MVVGRCPNGWAETDFSDYNSFVKEMKQTILNDGFAWLDNQGLAKDTYYDEDKDKECRYNINTSAFFRVSRKVLAQLKPETGIVKYNPRWFDHYVWTNLYCFSPKKGNANDKMIRIQLDGCRRLLLAQIKYYNPTHILFITDWDYWYEPFADLFVDVIKIGNSSKDNVIAKGVYENIKIVVGIRPDRTIPNKPNEEQYANDVIKAFEAI